MDRNLSAELAMMGLGIVMGLVIAMGINGWKAERACEARKCAAGTPVIVSGVGCSCVVKMEATRDE